MPGQDEIILRTRDVSVRIIALAPGEVAPWHFHREITDNMFCLSGNLEIHLRKPDQILSLQPGQRCEVQPGRVHRVVNPAAQEARYLLVQGVGTYDFNRIDP